MKALVAALVLAVAATFAAGADAKKKPAPKPKPKGLAYVNCAKLLPAAAADAATGGSLHLTSVTLGGIDRGPGRWLSDCTYHSATLADPPAGAIGYDVQPVAASTQKSYDNALAVYTKAAVRNAAAAQCQPGYTGPAPDSDFCQVVHPAGPNSFQLTGYLWILTPKYLVTVSRGGDGDAATVSALGKAVLARLH